jgi:hypothetical protein
VFVIKHAEYTTARGQCKFHCKLRIRKKKVVNFPLTDN